MKTSIPLAFIMRRIHSITGFLLVIFIIEHLITNSQVSLWIFDEESNFVTMVKFIHSLPFVVFLEIFLIALPFVLHAALGFKYMVSSSYKVFKPNPYRSRAYIWQRITAWILVFGILSHVLQMRVIEHPDKQSFDNQKYASAVISYDDGLLKLEKTMNFIILDKNEAFFEFNKKIDDDQVMVLCKNNAQALLLVIRNNFKSLFMSILYSFYVMTAVFHAFNGLWTLLISWGIILSELSQKIMLYVCIGLMIVFALLGFLPIWVTYFATR